MVPIINSRFCRFISIKMWQTDKAIKSYQNANEKLSKLITRGKYATSKNNYERLNQIRKELQILSIGDDDLHSLSVIHVTGTKGKGSTCALVESILRHYGLRTGFYSSPHLVDVRERIRLDGVPISIPLFLDYFNFVYDTFQRHVKDDANMPFYFRFLTHLALYTFIKEKVDVAVLEVGIGGEFDCTNVVTNVPVCGITSLGFDHCNLLGNTIEEIAWQKAGIIKPNCHTLTIDNQPESALKVIKERVSEKQAVLEIVPNFIEKITSESKSSTPLCFRNKVLKLNTSLALKLAYTYLKKLNHFKIPMTFHDFIDSKSTLDGLTSCNWPGRYQTLKYNNITFYLDGAHTDESIRLCAQWFQNESGNSPYRKYLVFNLTKDRTVHDKFVALSKIDFNCVIFTQNITTDVPSKHCLNNVQLDTNQLSKCYGFENYWKSNINQSTKTIVVPTIEQVVEFLSKESCDKQINVLVTGSIILVDKEPLLYPNGSCSVHLLYFVCCVCDFDEKCKFQSRDDLKV